MRTEKLIMMIPKMIALLIIKGNPTDQQLSQL